MKAVVFEVKPAGWMLCRLFAKKFPALRKSALDGFELREIPVPQLPGDDWVLLRTRLGGICGSDVALFTQKQPPNSLLQTYTSQPMLIGHENVATVEKVGSAVDSSWLGRRVTAEPTLGCQPRGTVPMCPRCQAGEFGACENFSGDMGGRYSLPAGSSIGYNSATGGSWGEFFVAHKSQLIALDDETISDEEALLIDPFACALHAVLRANSSAASRVLIYGSGVLAMGTVASLRATGFKGKIEVLCGRSKQLQEAVARMGADECFVLPRKKSERFEIMARRIGGTLQRARLGNYMISGGYDVVFDCIGTSVSFMECLKFARARGQVVMLGTLQEQILDISPLWFRELCILGSWGRSVENFDGQRLTTYELVLKFLKERKISTAGLVTNFFRIEDYRAALLASADKFSSGSIKTAFDFRN